MNRIASIVTLLLAVAVAVGVFVHGIGWGLPSRDADAHLFGERTPWTGAEIVALASNSTVDTLRGADVDADPILDRSLPVILNETDAQRAQIVRRYRLMSKQPDEFIQFKALAEMSGRSGFEKLDPRLYQYGGLWIYPVGALIRTGMLAGALESPTGDALAFYVDRPDAFGRFYVVARLYSAAWGLVAVGAVWWIVRRLTNDPYTSLLAAIAFAFMPVVWTAAQEAKPHLAGVALVLLATIAATRFVERGKLVWGLLAGALVGAAAGMVLSMAVAWGLLLTMGVLLKDRKPIARARVVLLASLAAAVVFVVTNPFLLVNALFRPEVLSSNLGNTAAMYPASVTGALRGLEILGMGSGWVVFGLGAVGLVILGVRHMQDRRREASSEFACGCAGAMAPIWLLLPVAGAVLAAFLVFATQKPPEYARFGMLVSVILVIAGFAGIKALLRKLDQTLVVAALVCGGAIWLALNDRSIAAEMREVEAQRLEGTRRSLERRPRVVIGTYFEPAPWSMPPFDLFERRIVLLPTQGPAAMDEHSETIAFPANLARDLGIDDDRERLDWKHAALIVVTTW